MDVFELFAKLSLDSSEYDKGLDASKTKATHFGQSIKTAFKVGAVAIGAATTAITAFGRKTLDSYAQYEQLAGGVETLFKGSADAVKQYAEDAYKTAGLSANEYMETVTSFSASLLQSLGGDTARAAEYANMAITDMSDNANKMGTAMESIQNAYQGFAKQNYTMLDNLKLGYGGTKTEMERLVTDAEALNSAFRATRDENDKLVLSYADVVDAIHIVQTNLDITGTTAKEATATISGSLSAMKSAWKNLITGIGRDNADLNKLVDDFVQSAETAAQNVIPRIEKIMQGVAQIVPKLAPLIQNELPKLLNAILPAALEVVTQLVVAIAKELPSILKSIVTAVVSVIDEIGHAIAEKVPALAFIFEHLKEVVAVLTGVFIGYKVAVLAATIAQQALNLAMMATPTGLVIAGIVALVAVIGILIASTDDIGEAFESAFNAIGEGISAIGEKIGQVVSKIANFFSKLFSSAMGWVQEFVNIGVRIVEGIWEGITAAWNWLVEKWTKLWDSLLGWIKDLLGIHSPSTVFADEIGKNMALGVGVGWEKAFGGVRKDIEKSLDFGEQNFSVSGSVNGAAGAGSIAAASEQSINVDFTLRLDDGTILQKLAHRIYPYAENETALRGVAL